MAYNSNAWQRALIKPLLFGIWIMNKHWREMATINLFPRFPHCYWNSAVLKITELGQNDYTYSKTYSSRLITSLYHFSHLFSVDCSPPYVVFWTMKHEDSICFSAKTYLKFMAINRHGYYSSPAVWYWFLNPRSWTLQFERWLFVILAHLNIICIHMDNCVPT